MNQFRILLIVSLVFCYASCNTVIKTVYGIKKPKLETNASLNSFLNENGLDPKNNIQFKDFRAFVMASQEGYLNIPDALFFNRDGNFVSYNKTAKDCNANVDSFIQDLETFNTYPVNLNVKISDFIQFLSIENTEEIYQADINVFITWTVYVGKLNDEKAFEWIKLLDQAKANGTNINYYLLNCDYQESWNLPKEVQKELGIKS